MNMTRRPIFLAIVAACFWLFPFTNSIAQPTFAERASKGTVLTLGRVTDNPKKRLSQMKPMASYLAKKLAPLGVTEVALFFTPSAAEMADALRNGKVDFISETLFTGIAFQETGNAEFLLTEWKKGVESYRSVFFAKQELGISKLSDLIGRKIAFEDRDSTSAYLVPNAMLRQHGLNLVRLQSFRDPVPDGKVGYAFAESEREIVRWVALGYTDAGAFSNLDWVDPNRATPVVRLGLGIFAESPPILRSVMIVRRDLDAAIKRELRQVLLRFEDDQTADEVKKAYFGVTKYTEIGPEQRQNIETIRTFRQSLEVD